MKHVPICRPLCRWGGAAALLVAGSGSWAQSCSFDNSGFAFGLVAETIGELAFARDAPTGTLLWDSGWRGSSVARVKCTGTSVRVRFGWSSPPVGCANLPAAGGTVCPTNLAGIGVQVQWARTGNPADGFSTWEGTQSDTTTPQTSGTVYLVHAHHRVRLFKTGPVSPGTLQLPSNVVGTSIYGAQSATLLNLQIPPVVVPARACALTNANQVVVLPPRNVNDFDGGAQGPPGGTAGLTPFNVALQCDADVSVSFRLDGAAVSGATGVLANSVGAGFATGVGVQVLRNDVPLPLATTQFHANSAGGGVVNIPLAARYYKTSTNLLPGTVSATATLTMTYQ